MAAALRLLNQGQPVEFLRLATIEQSLLDDPQHRSLRHVRKEPHRHEISPMIVVGIERPRLPVIVGMVQKRLAAALQNPGNLPQIRRDVVVLDMHHRVITKYGSDRRILDRREVRPVVDETIDVAEVLEPLGTYRDIGSVDIDHRSANCSR